MSNILYDIGNVIGSMIGKAKVEKAISREDVLESCQLVNQTQQIVVDGLSLIKGKEEESLLLQILAKPKDKFVAEGYTLFMKNLRSSAKRLLTEKFLGAPVEAEKRLAKLTNEIASNIDTLFKEKELKLNGTRISHASVMSIIKNANVVSAFIINLLDYARQDYLGTEKDIPRYRTMYIRDNAFTVASIVTDVIDKGNKYSFLAEIEKIRRDGQDLLLYTEGQTISAYGNEKDYAQISHGLRIGFSPIAIGLYIRNWYDNYRNQQHLYNQQLKGWMETRAAMMKLKMNNIDPSSEEYRRLETIAANYERLIAQYDEKINKYLSEEE